MLVKLPTWLSTLLNRSGRSQATVNAQMPPLLMPQMARPAASLRRLYDLATSGSISFSRKRAYWSDRVSYSKLRLARGFSFLLVAGTTPGLMKMPMVTGISFLWIRLSNANDTASTKQDCTLCVGIVTIVSTGTTITRSCDTGDVPDTATDRP